MRCDARNSLSSFALLPRHDAPSAVAALSSQIPLPDHRSRMRRAVSGLTMRITT